MSSSRKIRILYTTPNFDTAGSGKVIYDLAKELDKEKFEVEIACNHDKGALFQEIKKLGLPIHLMQVTKPLKPYFSLWSRIKPIARFFKSQQYDIVHSWHWSSDWSEVLAAKRSGAKFVYTKKAMTWGNIHWKIRSYLSDFILTINPEMRNYFSYKKNQALVPLGIDTDYYKPLGDTVKTNQKFKIITVANLVAVKGIEVLIRAIHELQNTAIVLEVLGDTRDPYALVLEALVAELKMESQVTFLGKHTDVRPFLEQADLYVIPSKKEGMPMALVEAMSMGLPVLGSDISGINYVLQDFKEYLFEEGNAVLLSEKIDFIYKKSPVERREIGQAMREYVLQNFSIQKFIKSHEALYFSLIKQ